jgi:hypothetical protein
MKLHEIIQPVKPTKELQTNPYLDFSYKNESIDDEDLDKIADYLHSQGYKKFEISQEKSRFCNIRIYDIPRHIVASRNALEDITVVLKNFIREASPSSSLYFYDSTLILDHVPTYPVFFDRIEVYVRRGEELTDVGKYIKAPSELYFYFPPTWVGGLLGILELKHVDFEGVYLTCLHPNNPVLETALNIVEQFLANAERDGTWDCQEKLEKDKSTKPFASY